MRRLSSAHRVVDELPPNHEVFTGRVREVVEFVSDLKELCDEYFLSQEKDTTTNYEDVSYVARQIEDGLLSEYENPALLPLNERFSTEAGRTPDELSELAGATTDYIDDIVCSLLGRPVAPVEHLTAVIDAFADDAIDDIALATLNHDVVIEHWVPYGWHPLLGWLRRDLRDAARLERHLRRPEPKAPEAAWLLRLVAIQLDP